MSFLTCENKRLGVCVLFLLHGNKCVQQGRCHQMLLSLPPPLAPAFLVLLPDQQEPKMCQMKRYNFNLWEFLKGSFRFGLNPTAGSRESLRKSIFPG